MLDLMVAMIVVALTQKLANDIHIKKFMLLNEKWSLNYKHGEIPEKSGSTLAIISQSS